MASGKMQLVAFLGTDTYLHYGELSDGHIFLGQDRRIFLEDCTFTAPDPAWVAYATRQMFEVETPSGWIASRVSNVNGHIVLKSGYTLPWIELENKTAVQHYVPMYKAPPIQPPVPTVAPPSVYVKQAPIETVSKQSIKKSVTILETEKKLSEEPRDTHTFKTLKLTVGTTKVAKRAEDSPLYMGDEARDSLAALAAAVAKSSTKKSAAVCRK